MKKVIKVIDGAEFDPEIMRNKSAAVVSGHVVLFHFLKSKKTFYNQIRRKRKKKMINVI